MSGIYIHIPFCRQACTYCDFHFSTSLKHRHEVVNAIVKEIDLRSGYLHDKHVETIYFGGGTPSLLAQKDLGRIMEAIAKNYDLSTVGEITLECNPDDLDDQTLSGLKALGVNRLSIGLQSFNEAELKWMNRAHTAAQSEACVKRAQDKGFENITIDLMYGSKFQSPAEWRQTMEKAVGLGVQHISAYNLTVEQRTKLGHDVASKKEPMVDEDKSSAFFLDMGFLEQHGFIHYEISNFGKDGYFSRHNANYWKGREYIGFGPSAHSFDGSSRQWNIANNALYSKHLQTGGIYFEKEILSEKDRFNEYILTSLRTIWGVDLGLVESTFGMFYEGLLKAAKPYLERNLVGIENGVLRLTTEGKLLADKIASDMFV